MPPRQGVWGHLRPPKEARGIGGRKPPNAIPCQNQNLKFVKVNLSRVVVLFHKPNITSAAVWGGQGEGKSELRVGRERESGRGTRGGAGSSRQLPTTREIMERIFVYAIKHSIQIRVIVSNCFGTSNMCYENSKQNISGATHQPCLKHLRRCMHLQ